LQLQLVYSTALLQDRFAWTHIHLPCILVATRNMANSGGRVEKGLCSRQQAAQDDAKVGT